jgi:hypothetical protein
VATDTFIVWAAAAAAKGGRRGDEDGNGNGSSDLVVLDVPVVPNAAGRGSCGDKVATAISLHDNARQLASSCLQLAACSLLQSPDARGLLHLAAMLIIVECVSSEQLLPANVTCSTNSSLP